MLDGRKQRPKSATQKAVEDKVFSLRVRSPATTSDGKYCELQCVLIVNVTVGIVVVVRALKCEHVTASAWRSRAISRCHFCHSHMGRHRLMKLCGQRSELLLMG